MPLSLDWSGDSPRKLQWYGGKCLSHDGHAVCDWSNFVERYGKKSQEEAKKVAFCDHHLVLIVNFSILYNLS